MLLGLIVALFLIMRNDRKRVNSIDTSEAMNVIEERKKKEKEEEKKKEKEEIEKKEKELSTFNSFELSFNRTEEPPANYYIKVGEDRTLKSVVEEICSNKDECNSNTKEQNDLRLTDYEYRLIIDLYNRLYTDEWPDNTKESFIVSVARLANGNKELYNSSGNGWGLYSKYDMDNDGRVLYREYGRYILEVFSY